MTNEYFMHVWNQLVLISGIEYFTFKGDSDEAFDLLEKQTRTGYADKKLTPKQYITLMNSISLWRDIFREERNEQTGEKAE